jgi:uncharacterized protein YbaA (DUF1428 family)
MKNYIDGFVFPIKKTHLEEYKKIADKVADIWKEYGALAYFECVDDGLKIKGTLSFDSLISKDIDETIVFGWMAFDSRETRDFAHQKVAADDRMIKLIEPLMNPSHLIFDASRMVYGGFKTLINK